MREAVFQVTVVILVRFGVDDDGVVDARGFGEGDVGFYGEGFRLIRRVGGQGKPLLVCGEEVDMRIDDGPRGVSGCFGCKGCGKGS